MAELRLRTPAQIGASRRNDARSRGSVTPEGKARASRNAVRHGLAAMTDLVLEGEDAGELEELTFRVPVETGAAWEIEARLARRLAIAFWKGERAERIEAALLASATPASFDIRRFNAIRSRRAQIGREIRSCLKALRELHKEVRRDCTVEPESREPQGRNRTNDLRQRTGEPEPTRRNEPESPQPPANDDAAETAACATSSAGVALKNEPGESQAEPQSPPSARGDGAVGEPASGLNSRRNPDRRRIAHETA